MLNEYRGNYLQNQALMLLGRRNRKFEVNIQFNAFEDDFKAFLFSQNFDNKALLLMSSGIMAG